MFKDCPDCGGKLYWNIFDGLICKKCGSIVRTSVFSGKTCIGE